ncbi:CaiB/BaiF CoA transferase family protein [Conexibacter arvalis]|uniref:Crotonobetainyl-CoA:carnitine CoA-transferase CaiB-like acyl-CoA transferase n=1 Tax=Conexibacter arvalis TaxID=912552 RepID=A0A840I6Y5_9ACTN|nr:CoA transferase [Conexibacter arvalis]MBB4660617.1 crotonobetainyl-CoA:carnitine CoA-transferase CaiB-like acyl-CoA transferase [Conexibacter arvalis]
MTGASAAERPTVPRAPLADVTVLAVEQFGAGPWGTRQLSDLGATVIKVEDPATGGDVGRYVPPYRDGEDSLFFETFNAGKRSISLDLKSAAGRAVLEDLVAGADALACNLRGDQPARLGLTYDALAHRNPRLVCCSLSGFGMTGPRAAEPAYDYIMQALSGWMSLTGEPDGPPTKSGLSLVDFCAGYAAALAIAAGVWRARRDGVGGDCDLSLYEVALSLLTYVGTWSATKEHEPVRHGESAHPSIVPFQAFEAADGWLTVACAKEKFWRRYCEVAGLGELLGDERFADMAARLRNRDELLAILRARMRERPVAAWVEALRAAGVPVGEVRTLPAALSDPQIEARDAIRSYAHPTFGEVRQIASALRISGHEAPLRPAPARGADQEQVLRELCGYDGERIEAARAQGAFGRDAG